MERKFVEVVLSAPVEFKGELVSVIKFYEPLGEDLLMFDKAKGDVERTMLVASSVSKLPVSEFKKMRASDFMACMQEVGKLLGEPQATQGS